MKSIQRQIVLIVVMFIFGQLSIGDALARNTIHNSDRNHKADNEIILSASSPFEDITDFSISADKEGIDRALQAYDAQAGTVESLLPASKRDDLRALVAAMKKALKQGEYHTIALTSPEAYRLLINTLDRSRLKVPIEVSLLDYAGFKFKALLHAKSPDWKTLQKVGHQAQKDWDAIKSKVTDKGLREAVDETIAGMNRASTSMNADMALFAAQVDLALVDLLESEFEKGGKKTPPENIVR